MLASGLKKKGLSVLDPYDFRFFPTSFVLYYVGNWSRLVWTGQDKSGASRIPSIDRNRSIRSTARSMNILRMIQRPLSAVAVGV